MASRDVVQGENGGILLNLLLIRTWYLIESRILCFLRVHTFLGLVDL